MKSFWKTVWQFLLKLNIHIPYDPAISVLRSYSGTGISTTARVAFGARRFGVGGAVLFMVGRLAAPLASAHWVLVARPTCDHQKYLQSLPNVPWRAKLPPLENHGPREMTNFVHTKPCAPVCIAVLFIITPNWKQPKCTSTNEWINKVWYTVQRYCSVIKGTTH